MMYGYARVSTDGRRPGVATGPGGMRKMFRETASGARTDRAELAKALAALDADDLLMVTRPDRLVRSTRDLLDMFGTIADSKAGSGSLAAHGPKPRLRMASRCLPSLVGWLAFERELIRARTRGRRSRANACGVKMGRSPKLTPH